MRAQLAIAPDSITPADAIHIQKIEAKVTGGHVPKDGVTAHVQHLAAVNQAKLAGVHLNEESDGNEENKPLREEKITESQEDKEHKYKAAVERVQEKIWNDPSAVTQKDADKLQSLEMQAHGTVEKDGYTSHLQSTIKRRQSEAARQHELAEAVELIKPKMEHEPEHVNQDDASLVKSAEMKAHGSVEKGGFAANVQRLATQNEKEGSMA